MTQLQNMAAYIFVLMGFFVLLPEGILSDSMIAPFPDWQIKEMSITGGSAGASSYYSDHWRPENGFKINQAPENGWHIGAASRLDSLPHMIWYDFKQPFVPAEISFQAAQANANSVQGTPTMFQFVGSNDAVCNDSSSWSILCEDLSDKSYRNVHEARYCKVKPEISRKFRCLGLRILANKRSDGWTSLRNIRIWERTFVE